MPIPAGLAFKKLKVLSKQKVVDVFLIVLWVFFLIFVLYVIMQVLD